jgi:MFS transporter, PPP family, 3-phenylpropionic acid transporter
MQPLPYWRLSSFYFWYFAIIGAFSPYFARWLHGLGLSGVAIGSIMAMWYGTRIVSPPVWSHICSNSRAPERWLHLGAVAAALSFGGFLFASEFWPLLLVMTAFGFFANAIMPQFEALTLARLGPRRVDYGRIRVWGSVGFLLVAVAYGPLLERVGEHTLPWLILPLLAATVLAALANGHVTEHLDAAIPRLGDVLRRREVRLFLLVVLLMQTGFGPFYVFFTIHLAEHGHSGDVIGMLWGLGVLAEIAVFALLPRLLPRLDAGSILRFCIAATVLRWSMVALLPESLPAMVAAQLMHALSFGAFHAACMQRVAEFFPGRLGQHGQGLLYGFSSGIGGVLGALMAGALWELHHGIGAFLGGAAICAAAWLLSSPRLAQARASG